MTPTKQKPIYQVNISIHLLKTKHNKPQVRLCDPQFTRK